MKIFNSNSRIFKFDYKIITKDRIEAANLDFIIDKVKTFMREDVFPKLVEFTMDSVEFTFKPLIEEASQIICMYTYDSIAYVDIYVSPVLLLTNKNRDIRQIFEDEFNILEKEYIEYFKEHADLDDSRYEKLLRKWEVD